MLEGDLRIDFRDGAVTISSGEMYVVPKGVEHKPYAAREVKMLLIEPRGVPNTGDVGLFPSHKPGDMTRSARSVATNCLTNAKPTLRLLRL